MEKLEEKPKYFVIQRDLNNPLWDKYIKWLNETYIKNKEYFWKGKDFMFYGYEGNNKIYHKGTNAYDNIRSFINNPILITLEQWEEVFLQKENKIHELWT